MVKKSISKALSNTAIGYSIYGIIHHWMPDWVKHHVALEMSKDTDCSGHGSARRLGEDWDTAQRTELKVEEKA